MKNYAEMDRKAYQLAREYLPNQGIPGVTAELVEKYLDPLAVTTKPKTLEAVYQIFLEAAQNASMKAAVIGRAMGGIDKLAPVLKGFSPSSVLQKYGDDWEALLDDIEAKVVLIQLCILSPILRWNQRK